MEGLAYSAVVYVLLGGLAVYFIEAGQPRYGRNLIVIIGGLLAAIAWITVIEARQTWMQRPTNSAHTQWPAAVCFVGTMAILLALGI